MRHAQETRLGEKYQVKIKNMTGQRRGVFFFFSRDKKDKKYGVLRDTTCQKIVIWIMKLFFYPLPVLRSLAPSISLSCQLFYGDDHRGKKVNYLAEMCSCLANQLWPCAAEGKGVTNQREECTVGNQDVLTHLKGTVMDRHRISQLSAVCLCCRPCLALLPH